MEAVFRVKSAKQKNYIVEYGIGKKRKRIRFNRSNGMYQTSDRQEIGILLRNANYNKDYELITEMELVEEWLEGNEPDKINREFTQDVSKEGLLKLAEAFRISGHGNKSNVIREMLLGKPVTQAAHTIKRKYTNETAPEDLIKKYEDLGAIVKKGPWYKVGNEAITRDRVELAKWVPENIELLDKKAKQAQEKETETETA